MSEKPVTGTGVGGEGAATGNSDGGTTMVAQKKRLRRVSFAEMTSVHFFDRDEDNEAPAEEVAAKASEDGNGANEREEKNDMLGFRELLDSRGEDVDEDRENGDGDSEDEELPILRRSFLRPAESPSTGSTCGSAISNDDAEDDFFGPVSANFIRPGRLSDSAASNDNPDVTMDSTAFSMHFRSLARSDSGVELKTPTGIRLSFEEKTPTKTTAGSFMELTVPKKPISLLSSPAGSSSDMSLVGEKSDKYDYGRISPELDALLAQGSKKSHAAPASDITVAPKSPQDLESDIFPSDKNGSGVMDILQNGKTGSSLDHRFGEANGGYSSTPISHSARGLSSNISKPLAPDVLINYSNSSPSNLSKMRTSPLHQDKLHLEDKYIQHESPLVELASSSPAKGRKILATSTSPARFMSMVTPQDKRWSHLCDESVKHNMSASSIQRSISKLKLLEASPFSSYLTAKIENSTFGSMNFSRNSPFSNLSERVINDFQMQHLDAPVTGTEVQPSEAFQKQVLCASSTDDNQIEDPVDGGHMILSGESVAAASSPPEFALSGKKMKPDFRSRSPREKELLTVGTGTDSSLAEIALDHDGRRKTVGTPEKVVLSPDKELENKWISPKLQGQLSNDLVLHDRLMRLKENFPGHESASKGQITYSSISTVSLDELDSFSLRRKVQLSSTLVGFSNSKLIDVKHHNQPNSFEITESLRTPTEAKASHFICPKKLDWGHQTGMELPSFEGDHPGGESEYALLSKDTSLKELILQKDLVDSFAKSPSRKEVEINNENKSLSNAEDILSPGTNKSGSLSRKRSNEVVAIEEINHTNELAAFQRSPKLQKIGNHELGTLRCPNGDGEETSAVVLNLKHWTDIYSRFLKDSENLLSPPMDKLDLSMIESVENILFNLQRSKTYRILHSQIYAQETSVIDDLSQRASEARSLLHQIFHEKLTSQLMCVKRQKLQEKVQLLSSGIQESQTLKLKFMQGCNGDAQVNAAALQNLVNSRNREEVECGKTIAMKQTLEALEKRSTNLIKSLTTACKVKEEPSLANSVALVTNHLMKKSCCRFIRLDMQNWIIDNVKSKSGNREIVLNYLDFIVQSLKVSVSPASSIMTISYKLEDINIMKNFPNMVACVAFSFVFNAETTRKYSGSRSLAQEIQVTSSFLGNLLDVAQEVQQAQMELRHLTQATFRCPLVGQLYLQLDFFKFKSGEKVTLTLDMSCLKRGVYPLQILPSQSTVTYGATSLPSAPVLDEIRGAVKNLRAGYTRILRLCRCVAQVIQVSRKL